LEKSQKKNYDKSLAGVFIFLVHAETPAVNAMETRAGGPQHKMAPSVESPMPIVSISDMYTHFMDLLPNLIALHIFQTKNKFLDFCFFVFFLSKGFKFKFELSSQIILKDNFFMLFFFFFFTKHEKQREDIDF
jgi:hypothetical protein